MLLGRIDDERHLDFATSQRRILLTGDADLLLIAERWARERRHHAGIVYWHPARCTVGSVIRILHDLVQSTTSDAMADRVTYIKWDAKPR